MRRLSRGDGVKKLVFVIGILFLVLIGLLLIGAKVIISHSDLTKAVYLAEINQSEDEIREEEQTVNDAPLQEDGVADEKADIPAMKKRTITLSAAGDCTLGFNYKQSLWNRFDTVAKENGYAYFFENVKGIFEKDDLTLVNLEGPLTTAAIFADKEFVFKGEPEYVNILTLGSVEAVNLANNHTKDYGEAGYSETQRVLQEAGIGFFGEQAVFYHEVNDIRVAVIGLKGWSNDKWIKDQLMKLIISAKEQADLIVIMFHWGEENVYYPTAVQKDLARYAIDAGAHLVLGSHPHVIQGIESYQGRNIVYSLGNFCFGGNRNPADKDTFIYQETFELTEQGIRSVKHEVIPCAISSIKDRNDYRPTPLEGEDKYLFEKRMERYNELK